MAEENRIIGSTEPRLYTPPLRELTNETSLGFACIEYAKNVLKKELYPWQCWVLIHMLEIVGSIEEGWHFRFRNVLILVARQNGKTVLSEVIASFFMNVLGVKLVLGTSLSVDKALEVLNEVVNDQESIPELKQEIKKVCRANGNNKLILKGERTYKIGAPNRRAGRGDSCDLVLLDELRECRTWDLWSAAVASTNAKPNAMVISFSNAGDPSSIVLRQIRAQAIAEIQKDTNKKQDFGGGDAEALGLFEWSADDECETTDEIQLAKANPALGHGLLTMRALLANQNTMPENQFRSEVLCQTVDSLLPEPFPKGAWDELLDPISTIPLANDVVYGIDMSADRKNVSIAVCGQREDGNWHIEMITKRSGVQWAIDWFRERAVKGKMKLAFQGRGAPVCSLAEEICTLAGIERCPVEGNVLADGWTRFYDCIATPEGTKIYHLDQPILNHCAKIMQLKKFGTGLTLPDRVKSPDDISPLFACIMAYSIASQTQQKQEKKVYESVYTEDYTLAFI